MKFLVKIQMVSISSNKLTQTQY